MIVLGVISFKNGPLLHTNREALGMRKLLVVAALVALCSCTAMAQDHPKAEVFGGYSYARINPGQGLQGGNLPGGWHASVAGNFNSWFGIVGEFSGHYGSPDFGSGTGVDTKVYTYTFGPRFSYRKNERVTPFAHVTFGGAHVNASGGGPDEGAFAMTFGGGLDAKINDHVAFRVGQFDYILTRFEGPTSGTTANQHNFRFSTGIVFRF
jgi:opacity protein-like surface antigen